MTERELRYLRNYEQIARDDITQDIMPLYYKNAQAKKAVGYCGRRRYDAVADIGVGKGLTLKLIQANHKVGVDIAYPYLEVLAREGIPVVMANAEALPFKDQFDLVILTDILEHVFDPAAVLHSCHCALKPGGRLLIRVPYKEDLSAYLPENGCKYEFVHLRSFDERGLTEMVQGAGLKLLRLHYDGFSWCRSRPFTKWVLTRLRSSVVSRIDRVVCHLPNWAGGLLFYPIEMVAICQKVQVGGKP